MRGLFETYKDIQKVRVALNNQLYAKENGLSEQQRTHIKEKVVAMLEDAETGLKNFAKAVLKHEPIWNDWLAGVKGIGPVFGMALLGFLGYCEKFDTISKVWRYAGLAVIDGKSERRKRGEKIHYNPTLKTLCWLIGESFVKTGNGYKELYKQFRKEYDEKWLERGECKSEVCKKLGRCTDMHRYMAAKRKTVKVFLAHYWLTARLMKGLPISKPYILGKDGHEHEIEVIKE